MNCATGSTSPTPGSRERRPPSTSAWTRTTTTGTSPSPTMRKLLTSRRGRGTSPRSTRARTMCSRGATTASSTPAREHQNINQMYSCLDSFLIRWPPIFWIGLDLMYDFEVRFHLKDSNITVECLHCLGKTHFADSPSAASDNTSSRTSMARKLCLPSRLLVMAG